MSQGQKKVSGGWLFKGPDVFFIHKSPDFSQAQKSG